MKFDAIRVFPMRTFYTPTDDMVCIGSPTERFLSMERDREVLISVAFTWEVERSYRLKAEWEKYFDNVRIGGPAISNYADHNNGEFEPGMFLRDGIVITSRGCIRKCPWCIVPRREGKLRPIEIKNGWLVEDSNLFALGIDHVRAVFDMLREQNRPIVLSGGGDARIFNEKHMELVNSIPVHSMFWGGDSLAALPHLKRVHDEFLYDKPRMMKVAFALLGFGESWEQCEYRLKKIEEIGMFPMPSLYFGYGKEQPRWDARWNKLTMHLQPWIVKGIESWFGDEGGLRPQCD